MQKFTSHAKWTKVEDSKDSHTSKEAARAVCKKLEECWGEGKKPCPIRGNIIKTWTQEEKSS